MFPLVISAIDMKRGWDLNDGRPGFEIFIVAKPGS